MDELIRLLEGPLFDWIAPLLIGGAFGSFAGGAFFANWLWSRVPQDEPEKPFDMLGGKHALR